jgi:hypothetical protein
MRAPPTRQPTAAPTIAPVSDGPGVPDGAVLIVELECVEDVGETSCDGVVLIVELECVEDVGETGCEGPGEHGGSFDAELLAREGGTWKAGIFVSGTCNWKVVVTVVEVIGFVDVP